MAKKIEVPAEEPVVEKEVAFGMEDDEQALFLEWAKGAEHPDLTAFQREGWLNKLHALTDEGTALLDAEKIGWRKYYFLKLGVPVTLTGGQTIMEGSSLQIMLGGYSERAGAQYWECYVSEELPRLTIYQHRLHSFWECSYPLAQKMTAKYSQVVERE